MTGLELREAQLDELYPGRWSFLLVPLCAPSPCAHHKNCAHPGKRPVGNRWNASAIERYRQSTAEDRSAYIQEVAVHLHAGGNVGLVIPPGVVAIDADTAEAAQWCAHALDGAAMQQTAKGCHFLVKVPEDASIKSSVGIEIVPGVSVDIRAGELGQIVCEPSIHETGAAYCWKSPLPVQIADLPDCSPFILHTITTASQSSSTTTSFGIPSISEGERNAHLFRIASGMRGRGRSRSEIGDELHQENQSRCAPPLDRAEVQSIVESVTDRYLAGDKDTQLTSALLGEGAQEFEPFVPLDPPERLPFPIEALSHVLRGFALAEAEATQTPVDMSAALVLAAVATAKAKRTSVEGRPGWTEPLPIWPIVISKPGTRKTQVFADVSRPIRRYEKERAKALAWQVAFDREQIAALEKCIETARKEYAARRGKGDEEHKARSDLETAVTELEEARENAARLPRYIADDATPEAVAELLYEHGERMALWSPEGGELFEMMMGRYSRNARANLGVYLAAHAGDAVTIDRKHGEPIHLEAPALTIAATVQPDVLNDIRSARVLRGRGLLGRFFWIYPVSLLGRRRTDPAPVPDAVHNRYEHLVRSLLDDSAQRILELDREAQDTLRAFQAEVEPRLAEDGDLAGMTDWAGKLVGLVVRLAGLLHEADHAGGAVPAAISADTVRSAIELGRYALSHAIFCFAEMADPHLRGALKVWRWVVKLGPDPVHDQDLFQRAKGGALAGAKQEGFAAAVKLLCEHGYIRVLEGRARRYVINPEALRHQRQLELGGLGG